MTEKPLLVIEQDNKKNLIITLYKEEDALMVIKQGIIEKHLLRANKEIHKLLHKEVKNKDL